MKRIYIRHSDNITTTQALRVAEVVMREYEEKKGIVTMTNGIVVEFSDYAKYPSLTIVKEEQK